MKKNHVEEKMKEILPKNPRKIGEHIPHDYDIFEEEAKLGKDSHNQFFVRFPRDVAEALKLDTGQIVKFIVKTKLPEADPEDTEVGIKIMRHKT